MEALKELLEERLVEHDNCRVEVQDKIKERGARALGDVDSLEGRGKMRKRRSPLSLTSSQKESGQETRK